MCVLRRAICTPTVFASCPLPQLYDNGPTTSSPTRAATNAVASDSSYSLYCRAYEEVAVCTVVSHTVVETDGRQSCPFTQIAGDELLELSLRPETSGMGLHTTPAEGEPAEMGQNPKNTKTPTR